jgi:hypothetical protein
MWERLNLARALVFRWPNDKRSFNRAKISLEAFLRLAEEEGFDPSQYEGSDLLASVGSLQPRC